MDCIGYQYVMISHDCILGNFVALSRVATLLGNLEAGDIWHIGSNATVLPKIKIGKNVIVGAGVVVTTDLTDNCTTVGVLVIVVQKN